MINNKDNETSLIEIKSNELDEYSGKKVSIANAFIQSREKTSLTESKMELLSIYKLSHEFNTVPKKDPFGNDYKVKSVELNASEIRAITGSKSHKLYSMIFDASIELKRKIIIIQDKESQQFVMKSLYNDVIYNNGKVILEFNPDVEPMFLNLSKDYTSLNLPIAMKFKSNGGFQLYKILKVHQFKIPEVDEFLSQEEQGEYVFTVGYQELRMQLGYIDLTQKELQKEMLKQNPNPELEKKPKFKKFTDFRMRVLDVGIEEINSFSDIYVTMETGKGAKNKVEKIIFHIQRNLEYYRNNGNAKKQKTTQQLLQNEKIGENEKQILYFKVMELFDDIPITLNDIKNICEAADYSFEKIEKAYKNSKNYNISNFTGWMITAIKEDYKDAIAVAKKEEQSYPQREMTKEDFERLEEQLLKKSKEKRTRLEPRFEQREMSGEELKELEEKIFNRPF